MIADLTGQIACQRCGRTDTVVVTPGPHPGGHHARADCTKCRCFIKWLAKPDAPSRRKGQAELVRRYSQGYCEMCLRTREQLPLPEVLEAHHMQPHAEGGSDERSNIWIVCTPCHRLIEHLRTYLGHYHRKPDPDAA